MLTKQTVLNNLAGLISGRTQPPPPGLVTAGPAVIHPPTKWRRDPGISDLVEYFEQPAKNAWDKLNSKEYDALFRQMALCRNDFAYAARNYFWITIKRTGEDALLRLNEAQEIIYSEIMKIRAQGRTQKLIILKARQLGASTVTEALIAWSTMFFPNSNAVVLSREAKHSAYLYGILLHILDHLPWWLQPMVSSRKLEDGLVFDNPSEEDRRIHPGLHSRIDVNVTGRGIALTGVHASELASWPVEVARDTIEGDLKEGLDDNSPRSFAIIESTAKGAGTYYHALWNSNVQLRENAEWHTVFFPWFFEKSRFIAPEKGWRPLEPELTMREKVRSEWCRCDNARCMVFREISLVGGVEDHIKEGVPCPVCKTGIMREYILSDGQLKYIHKKRVNAEKDKESLKAYKEELPTTANEAFQVSGYQLFPTEVQEYVDRCTRKPIARGFIDTKGAFHGVKRLVMNASGTEIAVECWHRDCNQDHRYDPMPMEIWEFPEKNQDYACGVDVAEGLGGQADYSVCWVNRLGKGPNPDVQVAMYRSNEIDPITFAHPVNVIGRWYNDALMSIEYNIFDTCANTVRYTYQYPHLFRWKHLDNTKDPMANKWHWFTQYNTKHRLWQTAIKWLRSKIWVVQSDIFAQEMKTFQKDEADDRVGGHARGFHDDVCMAAMICLYCLAPESRVLTSDLRWVQIGACKVGDKLIGFDECICGQRGGPPSLLRESSVTSMEFRQEQRFKIVTNKGSVIASGHHGWATTKAKAHSANVRQWVTTENLRPGDEIIQFSRPWEEEKSPEAQWLAGLLDGEGCIWMPHRHLLKVGRNVGRGSVSFSQKPGVVLDKALRVCESLGIRTSIRGNGGASTTKIVELMTDGERSTLEVVGRIRPVRLLENAERVWKDRPFIGWHWPMDTATVFSIEELGMGPVVSMGTTTKTLFAEGLASHNCSHDMDWDENTQQIAVKNDPTVPTTGDYQMTCTKCGHNWDTDNPEPWSHPSNGCPNCKSIILRASRPGQYLGYETPQYEDMGGGAPVARGEMPDYNQV